MRITGGVWRSRRLSGPGPKSPVRPTPDALRERAFAVLGLAVEGATVLDLFAGTGSVGLEALSRGAERVVFVEQHPATARLVSRNCEALDVDREVGRVMVRPAIKAVGELGRSGERFDIVWADPPFGEWQEGLQALIAAAEVGIVNSQGLVCLECPDKAELPKDLAGLQLWRVLEGGASRLVMMRAEGGGE